MFAGDVPVGVRVNAAEFADKCRARVWERVGRVNWRPFEEAREWVRKLGLGGHAQWQRFCIGVPKGTVSKPPDIPSAPNVIYGKAGWSGWGDWVGTGFIAWARRPMRSFQGARAWVRKLQLRNQKQWREFLRGERLDLPLKPDDIPATPEEVYKDAGWTNWGDWLGSETVRWGDIEYLSFHEARAWVRRLGLQSESQWRLWTSGVDSAKPPKPDFIPSRPDSAYKHAGWTSWGDWLGSGTVRNGEVEYLSFKRARSWARKLQLASQVKWFDLCANRTSNNPRKPVGVPSRPDWVYRDRGWINWSDWLGNGRKPPRSRKRS